ncbi:MAG: dipicolinate synthase subunit DpsA [Dethiobacter sp.]|nr:dipicolinate synthase subunit DpsA [Dethiobacter sp.]
MLLRNNGLQGWKVLIAGGDRREIFLAADLAKKGADVWLYGFEKCLLPSEMLLRTGLPEQADVIVCPLPGMDGEGKIFAPFAEQPCTLDSLQRFFLPEVLLICGRMPAHCQQALEKAGVHVFLSGEDDELAILNAIPTAEGAVEIAMRESSITIHGSESLVIGFGRCGLPLARTLQGIGASVTVAVRRREAQALALALGFTAAGMEELGRLVKTCDFIFNTVPALILTADVLAATNRNALIVDIASRPGGTDFDNAAKLGIKSFLAPGLPGQVAPVTAGKILGRVYLPLIHTLGRRRD